MNLRRWVFVYLVAGSDFTRLMLLAFYGGAVIVVVLVGLLGLSSVGGIVSRLAR